MSVSSFVMQVKHVVKLGANAAVPGTSIYSVAKIIEMKTIQTL